MKPYDVYPLHPVKITNAKFSTLWDDKGNEYLDFYGGHAVISVGHSHPHYVKTVSEQLKKIGFYSNMVINPLQVKMAELLGELSGYRDYDLFLCNSGAEANENAFKLASFHTGKKKFVVMKNSFHGRTSAAVAATDDLSLRAPVNESDHFIFVKMNDPDELEAVFSEYDIAGVVVEGIQGIAGIYEPGEAYLQFIQQLCRQNNAFFIVDEIQSGCGRTGKYFAHQHYGITPDIITAAKGIGNGFPLGGVLIHPRIKARHKLLGSTFGGNHLACAAALAVLEIIKDEKLMEAATEKGNYLRKKLEKIPLVRQIRGKGLMIGAELSVLASGVSKQLLSEAGIFTGSANQPHTLRLLPPLCISYSEMDYFIEALEKISEKFHAEHELTENQV